MNRAYVKVHRYGGETIVAICDEELLGKELVHGELKIRIEEDFFGGELVEIERIADYIRNASMVNVFGNKSVNELGKIYPKLIEAAIEIGGVLHVQIFKSKKW
ncbi:MAG: DUF424 domain-containing protein [Thermoprotei archaeon]|nr:MAG: DUF424 domain-containing protein [Thermoprotei archaeon]